MNQESMRRLFWERIWKGSRTETAGGRKCCWMSNSEIGGKGVNRDDAGWKD